MSLHPMHNCTDSLFDGSGNFEAWKRNYGMPHRGALGAQIASGSSFSSVSRIPLHEIQTNNLYALTCCISATVEEKYPKGVWATWWLDKTPGIGMIILGSVTGSESTRFVLAASTNRVEHGR